jgi:hypothetical protein
VAAAGCLLLGAHVSWSGAGDTNQKGLIEKAKQIFQNQLKQAKEKNLANPSVARKEGDEAGWETKIIKDDKGKDVQVKVFVGNGKKGAGVARVEPVDPMGIPLPPPPPGPGPAPPPQVQLCVKVWAELSDEQGTQTGKFVNIEMFKWQPDQRFYFWCDAPVPVQLSLLQYYNVGPQEAKDPKLVSPNPAFPNTYATVVPGQPFRFPQLFKCDHTQRDEFVTLTVLQAGAPIPVPPSPGQAPQPTVPPINQPSPPPPTPTTPPAPVTPTVLSQQNTMLSLVSQNTMLVRKEKDGSIKLSYNKEKEPYRLEAINPVLPPVGGPPGTPPMPPTGAPPAGPTTFTSPDFNVVCMYALGTQTMGMLPLRFSK